MQKVVFPYLTQEGTLHIQAIQWPETCACCNGPEANTRYTVEHQAEYQTVDANQVSYYPLSWHVPYCPDCYRHASRTPLITVGIFLAAGAIWVGIGYGLFLMGQAEEVIGIALFLLSLAVLGFIGYRLRVPVLDRLAPTRPSCGTRDYAVEVSSSAVEQQVTITFHNDDYARAFVALNQP